MIYLYKKGLLVVISKPFVFEKRCNMEEEGEFLIIKGSEEIIIISDAETTIITDRRGLCWGE